MIKRIFRPKRNNEFFFLLLDHPFQRRFTDLGKDIIGELDERLKRDEVAVRYISKSFGLKGRLAPEVILELFPDTPVKLFKDVLEALQLYDLVELLSEKPRKSRLGRSLRPALSLQEIEKLRKTADPRPTTYHSNVAVLIITEEKNHRTEGIERFFKGLSSKSDVTVLEWNVLSLVASEHRLWFEKAVQAVIERWIHNQGW